MKAIVCTKYGSPDVLNLTVVEKPTPKDHEVLVKIYATTVTSGDCISRKGEPFIARLVTGFLKPKNPVLGHELAGEIASIGQAVQRFKTGDLVFGSTGLASGTHAEYINLPEDATLTIKPTQMTYAEAAAVPVGALTALFFLRKGNIQPRQNVLIYGASGSVGTYALQLAKHFGAAVTGVCSTANLEWVKALGADRVIDYTAADFTKTATNPEESYNLIFDTVGKTSFSSCKTCLVKDGFYVSTAVSLSLVMQMIMSSIVGDRKVQVGIVDENPEALSFIQELIEAGKIKAVIDRQYPLEKIAEAHRYVEQGHKKGNVVITVEHSH